MGSTFQLQIKEIDPNHWKEYRIDNKIHVTRSKQKPGSRAYINQKKTIGMTQRNQRCLRFAKLV